MDAGFLKDLTCTQESFWEFARNLNFILTCRQAGGWTKRFANPKNPITAPPSSVIAKSQADN